MRALLGLLRNGGLLNKEQCLDGIPLGLGHGLQGRSRLGTGRNRHLGSYTQLEAVEWRNFIAPP